MLSTLFYNFFFIYRNISTTYFQSRLQQSCCLMESVDAFKFKLIEAILKVLSTLKESNLYDGKSSPGLFI